MNLPLPPDVAIGVALIMVLLTVLIHLSFACAVAFDAARLPGGRRPEYVGPFVWLLATLLGGPFVAAAYWIMHHSTLCPFVYCKCQVELNEDRSRRSV